MSSNEHQVERVGDRIAVNGEFHTQESVDDLAAKLAPFVSKPKAKAKKAS